MENQIRVCDLWDCSATLAGAYLKAFNYPWEALPGIADCIRELGSALPETDYIKTEEDVWIAKSATVFPSAYIKGPAIIGPRSEVRHCAFIRGSALVGADCVVGNSTELKNVILFDHVQVPHFNYVGDSILGQYSHLGAGAITSNVKGDHNLVRIRLGNKKIDTGLKKVGAMLADYVEIGSQTVLNPGTIIGKGSRVYPLTMLRGVIPAGSLVKHNGAIIALEDKGLE